MGRVVQRMTALKAEKATNPGLLHDGGGLYLQITKAKAGGATKSWLFRYKTAAGSSRWMGLGSLVDVSLAEARQKAGGARKLREQGVDPVEQRKAQRAQERLADAKSMTFDQCRDAYIAAHRAGWRNPKHRQQWTNTLATYVTPVFGRLPAQTIDVGLVMKVLEPIWSTKPETAGRVRGRIESILDWAKVRGYRAGENPARWRGHLDHLLPARAKVRKVKHHAALSYGEIGTFMTELRERGGVAAKALEFLILTAARTGEVTGATWSEIDLKARLWVIPGDRMKGGREHRVPLNAPAMAVLRHMGTIRQGDHIFPGDRRNMLSNMAMDMLLRRMGRDDVTVHGFRSTFRDWCGEATSFQREIAEAALAHVVGDETERAYRRGDALEKRRRLMDAWAEFCAKAPVTGTVVPLRSVR